jgi:hypothetical protein
MRNKIFFTICIICILFFLTPQLYAEYYKYKDNNGNIVFTDNLSQVPPDQRSGVKSYQTIKSNKPLSVKTENTLPVVDKTEQEVRLDDFEKQRDVLDREYAILIRERDQLLREKNLINTPVKQELYNQKVVNLNQRIDSFKQRIKDFNQKIAQ